MRLHTKAFDKRMTFLFGGVLLLGSLLTSCASFIDKPEKILKAKYKEASQCPRIYKVYVERDHHYYFGDKHAYHCQIKIGDKRTSSCKKITDFSMDWFISKNMMENMDQGAILKRKTDKVCIKHVPRNQAEYVLHEKSTLREPNRFLWAMISGATLTIIPAWSYQKVSREYTISSIGGTKSSSFKTESKARYWIHLLLLPFQFFIGDQDAEAKLIEHNDELIYQKLRAMD